MSFINKYYGVYFRQFGNTYIFQKLIVKGSEFKPLDYSAVYSGKYCNKAYWFDNLSDALEFCSQLKG